MILTPHILVGAAIGSQISNPILVVIFAYLSHFVLDSLPHWEYTIDGLKKQKYSKKFYKDLAKVLFDLLFGFSLVLLVILYFRDINPPVQTLFLILLGGFFAALPDSVTFSHWQTKYKILSWINIIHGPVQPSNWYPNKINPSRIGFIVEVATIILAINVLLG